MKILPLLPLSAIVNSTDARAPHADISNASHLMGDVSDDYGDVDALYGDASYGDASYGDVNTAALNTWDTLIGDAEEVGGPSLKRKLLIGGGVAAAGAGAYAIARAIKQKRAKAARVKNALAGSGHANTISNQIAARRLMGKVDRSAQFPFYQIIGATLNSFPLAPTEAFAADTLKYNMDRQSTDTPFEVEIANGIYSAPQFTCTAVGTAATRYYTGLFLTVGIAILNANPGTIFSVTGSFPTVNGGSLIISTNPFSFTLRASVYYAKFLMFPWQLVVNKPVLALGAYNSTPATNIVVNVAGLPASATVNLIVPGSLHPWTIAMRNRLI